MSTIALAPARPSVRRPGVGRGRPAHPSRVAQRRPVGVRPPRLTFVEPTAQACRVLSPVPSVEAAVAGGWRLTARGVGVVVSLTGALMSTALVAMVMRFMVVTAG